MGYLVTFAVGMVPAFLVGFFGFKIRIRWCTECGTVKRCPICAGAAGSVAAQRLPVTRTRRRWGWLPGWFRRRAVVR